jgi:hypothetical protein
MKIGGQLPQMKLRLPPELKLWLQQQAIANRRSLNAEVVFQLETVLTKENAPLAGTGEALEAE